LLHLYSSPEHVHSFATVAQCTQIWGNIENLLKFCRISDTSQSGSLIAAVFGTFDCSRSAGDLAPPKKKWSQTLQLKSPHRLDVKGLFLQP
jgi:hypothetical protein